MHLKLDFGFKCMVLKQDFKFKCMYLNLNSFNKSERLFECQYFWHLKCINAFINLDILAHESSNSSVDSKQSLGNSRPTDFSNY